MQATERSFSGIIKVEYPRENYHIPKYQRAYEWRQQQWEQLYDDIDSNPPDSEHFIGSIICIDKRHTQSTKPGRENIYELIDGQQRLTTLSLLLAAIYRQLMSMEGESELSEELQESRKSIRRKLVVDVESLATDGALAVNGHNILLRVQPSTQKSNLDDFLHIMFDCGVLSEHVGPPKNFGNRLMAKAYRYFGDRVPQKAECIESLLLKINGLQMVHISVNSYVDAFRLFETLNNRGIPLNAIDIIKNQMLSALEKQNVPIEDAYDQWQRLLNYIEGNEDRFLRQFYNAFKHRDEIGIPKYPGKVTKSTLIGVYEALIKKSPCFLFTDLEKKAKTYNGLISPSEESQIGRELLDLGRIGAAASYALLLYLRSLESGSLADAHLMDIVQFLQKYYVRRNITDQPPTRDLDQLQIDTIDACVNRIRAGEKIDANFVAKTMMEEQGKPASLSEFEQLLKDNLFLQNVSMTRYLLCKLDMLEHTREYAPDLWARDKNGKFVWTIEHVLPQGEKLRQEWVDMIAQNHPAKAKEIQDEYVHCLGNLTLSRYNSRLSNHGFTQKQQKTDMIKSVKIGYKNGLHLNNLCFSMNGQQHCLADIPKWTKESIIARNENMVQQLLDHYKFEGEQ